MIDLHCHILPAVDDGPDDLQTTLEMFSIAERDGITQIVATPHYRHGGYPTLQDIQEKIRQVQGELDKRGMAVKLLGGADIRLTYELLEGMAKKEIPTINNSRYFLLELPDLIPPHLDDFLFEVRIKGYVSVITHPERNYSLLSTPEKIESIRDAGALFQLTAMSVTGKLGRQIKKFAEQLLKKGYVDFIATDAHNTERRPPLLSKAYRATSDILDKHEADRIFLENPHAVIENREITV
ncbi:MAG: protein-tyrosine-phosphatase [Nitrospirae bacterium]|nr:protein-tyrosine-phosphatase [Nitrospirota bacterium]